MMKTTKLYKTLSIVLGAFLLSSCGAATQGFVAPDNATISSPGDSTIVVQAVTNVVFPISVISVDSVPMNGIELNLVCSGCSFLDAPTPPRFPQTVDLSSYVLVGNPYKVKTDETGQYTVLVQLTAPAVDATYEASVGIYSGNNSKSSKITVSNPAP